MAAFVVGETNDSGNNFWRSFELAVGIFDAICEGRNARGGIWLFKFGSWILFPFWRIESLKNELGSAWSSDKCIELIAPNWLYPFLMFRLFCHLVSQAKFAMEQNLASGEKDSFDTKESKESESCLDSGDSFDTTASGMILRTFLDQNSSWVEATEEEGNEEMPQVLKQEKTERKESWRKVWEYWGRSHVNSLTGKGECWWNGTAVAQSLYSWPKRDTSNFDKQYNARIMISLIWLIQYTHIRPKEKKYKWIT